MSAGIYGRFVADQGDLYGPQAGTIMAESDWHGQDGGADLQGSQDRPGGVAHSSDAVPATTLLSGWYGSFLAKPSLWLAVGVLGFVLLKLVEENKYGKEGFSEIKLGATNVLKIGGVALIAFALFRWASNRVEVPGVSPFVRFATGGAAQ